MRMVQIAVCLQVRLTLILVVVFEGLVKVILTLFFQADRVKFNCVLLDLVQNITYEKIISEGLSVLGYESTKIISLY